MAFRQTAGLRIAIWQIMLLGAVGMLITGEVAPVDALRSIDVGIMVFLFCMFVVGAALEESGLLVRMSGAVLGRFGTGPRFILILVFAAGIGSAILMNDTLAVIGTPLVLGYARMTGASPKVLLLALAFSVTTGSVASPIGNPQNLLVATAGGFSDPVVTFFIALAPPTAIALLLVCFFLLLIDPALLHLRIDRTISEVSVADPGLSRLACLSLIVIAVLIAATVLLSLCGGTGIPLPAIAMVAAFPLVLFSSRRLDLLRQVDWPTLIFFAAMFVVMEGVRESGAVAGIFQDLGPAAVGIPAIITLGIVLSQFVSNVPFVALALPILVDAGVGEAGMLALAAGSTIAGNLTVIGAASNVIIIQGAERRGVHLGFFAFMKVGLPLTLMQAAVYIAWLALL
ncbi:SLC13 family permease [Methanofollis tationis]